MNLEQVVLHMAMMRLARDARERGMEFLARIYSAQATIIARAVYRNDNIHKS